MLVLGLDTSSPMATVGVATEDHIIAEKVYTPQKDTSESLIGYIDEVLADAGVTLREVDGLALVSGPGSLTGLRVAWATICGLAQPRALPIAALGVAEAFRLSLDTSEVVSLDSTICLVHHRGNQFYWLPLTTNTSGADDVYQSLTVEEFTSSLVKQLDIVGPGLLKAREHLHRIDSVKLALAGHEVVGGGHIAMFGARKIKGGEPIGVNDCPLDYGLPPAFRKHQRK